MSKLLYPNVIASTVFGFTEGGFEPAMYAQLSTNDNETEVEVNVYWHIPSDRTKQPYLVVDIVDYNDDGEDRVSRVKVTHNDGTVYTSIKEDQS